MKTIQLVFLLFALAFAMPARAQDDICQNGNCVNCLGPTCVYGHCTGYCSCNTRCIQGRCGCSGTGLCTTRPDGTINCEYAAVKPAAGTKPDAAKQCGKKVDASTLKAYPWISSTAFVSQLVSHSSVRDLEWLLSDLQLTIAEQGLANHLEIQTGDYIGEKPAVVRSAADVHLSELVGLTVTLNPTQGSYVFKVYRDVAGPGGETKYLSIRQMVLDKIPPVEVITVNGHSYEYLTSEGKTETGTF
jgi:hypothetical protein